LPAGLKAPKEWSKAHDVTRVMGDVDMVLAELKRTGVALTTMGRGIDDDRIFFECAAAAGLIATEMLMPKAKAPLALESPSSNQPESESETEIVCLRS
jgi:hypothetical protein